MAVTYRQVGGDRTVTVPEPDDTPVRRRKQRAAAIRRLDTSKDWRRVEDPAPDVEAPPAGPVPGPPVRGDAGADPAGEPTPDGADRPPTVEASPAAEPSPAEVRAWLREQGRPVPRRGRLPDDVVDAYKAWRAERA